MTDLTAYDPADVALENLRFRDELRTAVATGDHPNADAVVTRHFGTDVVEPTVLRDGEELIDATPPSLDQFEDMEERIDGDGIYAVIEGTIDGHTYTIRLTARDDMIEHASGERATKALRVR